MSEDRTLAEVLGDARDEANVLRKNGHREQAESLERFADAVVRAAEDFLTKLSEDDAMLQSGHSRKWFRARFADWSTRGLAGVASGRRWYLRIVVPQRVHVSAAREAGREAGRRAS